METRDRIIQKIENAIKNAKNNIYFEEDELNALITLVER